MKLLFAGTPEFAATALTALLNSSHSVDAIYTQPDRPAGRGRKLQASPVKILAEAHHLPVLQPETLRDKDEQIRLREFGVDVMVVAAYGLILPRAVLMAPRLGCLNIHASLLPRWRGAAPIQRALLAGDEESGVTIMQMERRLDTGPMLSSHTCPILPTDTAATLHDRLAAMGASAIVEVLDNLERGGINPQSQDETRTTYATKLDKTEAKLDWQRSAQELARQVRAFDPYPVAQTYSGETVIRVWQATATSDAIPSGIVPGTILTTNRTGVSVATSDGILVLHKVQLPGGRPLKIAEILNASHARLFQPGIVFS
ncbi:10-formyltetrahydrofolate:L-methionyl-tRNA(fMet) N-formyltransferase [Gammaproteobacteria bacterium]